MPQFYCSYCQTTFQHQRGEKLRCPRCLRQNGLEELVDAASSRRSPFVSRKVLPILLGAFVLALLGSATFLFIRTKTQVPKPGQLAILDPQLLKRTLLQRGVPEIAIPNPFEAKQNIAQLLKGIPTKHDPREQALSIARGLSSKIKHVVVALSDDVDGPVRSAEKLAGALLQGKVKSVHSYELAVLLVTLLRQQGLSTILCQTHKVDAPTPSADPLGGHGRYLAAIYPSGKLGQEPLLILDPARATKLPSWAGSSGQPNMPFELDEFVPLDDGSAAAHMLALDSLALSDSDKNSDKAYELSLWAIRAAAPSCTLHASRALVLVRFGGIQDAISEARTALTLCDDAPRRTCLARVLLAANEPSEAISHLETAIKKEPHYWPAMQTLAVLYWSIGKNENGNEQMKAAIRLAPKEPTVLQMQAVRQMANGEFESAAKFLREAAKIQPNEQVLFQLYLCLLQLRKVEEAKEIERELFAISKNREELKNMLAKIQAASSTPPDVEVAEPPPSPRIPKLTLPDVSMGSGR
ncbi:MAG: tetratricopeptide repeat protein [Pseudomonadota bacterium]